MRGTFINSFPLFHKRGSRIVGVIVYKQITFSPLLSLLTEIYRSVQGHIGTMSYRLFRLYIDYMAYIPYVRYGEIPGLTLKPLTYNKNIKYNFISVCD